MALTACSNHGAGTSSATSPPPASSGGPVIAWAPPPDDATEADKKAAGDAVGVFIEPCLYRFPDDGTVEAYAKEKGLTPMSAEEVSALLGSDPGEGWTRQNSFGTYRLTIEKPPYHACAVRKAFAQPPKALKSYLFLMVAMWVTTSKAGQLTEQPALSVQIDGHPTVANTFQLTGEDGKLKEQFILLTTDMPDGSYQVRMVRQIAPA